uniref:TraX family protein n=1 Tax=Agathobacter rectalis TaxID=39491 RepID=UPI0040295176
MQWHIGGIVSDVANMIFALPIMPLYNNQKGKNFKYFFYIYYVAHVVILWILSNFL